MSGGFVVLYRSRLIVCWLALVGVAILPNLATTSASATTYSTQQLVQLAKSYVKQNSAQWQIDIGQLQVAKVIATDDGLTTIRFKQTVSDVPVLNSLVAVTLLSDGSYLSHVSKLSSSQEVSPLHTTARSASELAVTAFVNQNRTSNDSSSVVSAHSVIADPALVDFVHGAAQRVWQVKIQNSDHPELASSVFIDDKTSRPLAIRKMSRPFGAFPMPYVCDLQRTKPSSHFAADVSTKRIGNLNRKYIGRTNSYPLCEKSDRARVTSSSAPAIKAITETVNYFRDKVGLDIAAEQYLGNIAPYANFGKNVDAKSYCNRYPKSKYCVATISGYTNVCAYDSQSHKVECPLENAFWVPWQTSECHSGVCSGIFFGKGFDQANDVVAHELAHGVTGSDAFPGGLCDSCDAGSVSEALSDYFGEAVDQLNPSSNEAVDADWKMGEDIKGGPFRNMAMVGNTESCMTAYDWVPIKQIDSTWNSRCDSHTNLGPADRFAWLISNGGAQNGIEVSSIGTAPWNSNHDYQLCNKSGSNCTATVNMTRLAFQVLAKLDGNISYTEFGNALNQACTDLTSAKKDPFPSSYCNEVRNALAATGIDALRITNLTRVFNYTGTPVTISAKFGTSDSIAGSAVPMRLQFQPTGTQSWQSLDTEDTDSSGTVNFSVTFPDSGSYRVSTVPSASVGTYQSSAYTIN